MNAAGPLRNAGRGHPRKTATQERPGRATPFARAASPVPRRRVSLRRDGPSAAQDSYREGTYEFPCRGGAAVGTWVAS